MTNINVLVASNNATKFDEISTIINNLNNTILADADIHFNLHKPSEYERIDSTGLSIHENGSSYEENAMLKGAAWFNLFEMNGQMGENKNQLQCIITDDVGISVDEWGGFPGLYTHRIGKYYPVEKLMNLRSRAHQHAGIAITAITWDRRPIGNNMYTSEKQVDGFLCNELKDTYPMYYMNAFIPNFANCTYAEMGYDKMCMCTPRAFALQDAILQYLSDDYLNRCLVDKL